MDNLPYAADAATSLTPAELNILRTQFQREGPKASVQTKFNYAWGLVKSERRSDQTEGLSLLREIYSSTPERARECLYYLALGNYKLGSYADARKYNETLLSLEPKNAQAFSLKSLIDERVAKDGFIGMAIVAGLAAAGGILIAGLIKHSKK